MATPHEQVERLQRFWSALGRKLRGPGHFASNLIVAWLDHDLRGYIARKRQTAFGRFYLRVLLTLGALGMAGLAVLAGPVAGWVLAIFWMYMDLPSIWARIDPHEEIAP